MEFIIAILLGWLFLLTISLQRTYAHVPSRELKRRARQGDELAEALHRAAAYGYSLRLILWILVGIFGAIFFVYVSRSTATWFAVFASGVVIWLGFIWLPASNVSSISQRTAAVLAPVFAWILQYTHRPISWVVEYIRRHRPVRVHTGLYEKADLLDLLEKQEVQADNRIEQSELEIAKNAMMFGNRLVRDAMTPRRVVKTVSAGETIGPVLMTELHKSGHSRFPVFEGDKDKFVGTLFLRDLVNAKAGGKVRGKMVPTALYLHEDQPLHDALSAILRTHHHLYIVVNTFEEYVGVISIEDVLEKILGKQIVDEFDSHHDMRAVARNLADKEHQAHLKSEKTATKARPEPDDTIEVE
ncbi:MAG: CBS domain-containing protein [Candidatus Saccharibacteria bacterium]|nr:CBS domain-containing protein [Candidatus Saccharibacteria bacterium]